MKDRDWLEGLAGAKATPGGQLQCGDAIRLNKLTQSRLRSTLSRLYEALEEALLIYNDLASTNRQMRLMKVGDPSSDAFILLVGLAQLLVTFDGHHLQVTLQQAADFRIKGQLCMRLEPKADSFGSISWVSNESSLLLSEEQLIRQFFELVAMAGFE